MDKPPDVTMLTFSGRVLALLKVMNLVFVHSRQVSENKGRPAAVTEKKSGALQQPEPDKEHINICTVCIICI